jgi:Ca-activated chloride channel family protein
LTGVVSTGVPIQELTSITHQVIVRSIDQGRAEIVLADSEQSSGNRDFVLRYRLAGQTISSGLLLYQGRDENFFLLMAEPPQNVTADEIPAREYVFVVDVSGSMNGFPSETAKKLMGDLVNVLRPSDTFNIVVFADGFETFSHVSVPATRPNLTRALRFLGRKDGGGGTRLQGALERAVAIPRQPAVSRSIVLLTDGYIEAEAEVFDYVRDQLDDANFFAFGIGSSVNRFLIEGVARAGLGEPFIVTDPSEATAAAERLRRYIDSPVLTGIDVQFLGFDAYDVEPKRIPDLFASRPIVVFGKWRGSPSGSIEIAGKTGRGSYQTTIAIAPLESNARHSALRHLWARTRIAELSDFGPGAPEQDRVDEITSLGLTYGLLTRYTSFVAVQEIVRTTGRRHPSVRRDRRVLWRPGRAERTRAASGWQRSRRQVRTMKLGIRAAIVRAFRRAALPLASYYGVTLALPLANGAARAGAAFVEHALVVLFVPPCLITVACATHEVARAFIGGCSRPISR